MVFFCSSGVLAALLSVLAVRKLLRREPFLGGDLFWIATTMYFWFLAYEEAAATFSSDATQHALILDKGWLLGGGAVMVIATFAYSKASWPPFRNPDGRRAAALGDRNSIHKKP